jgi:hypothetical protein
LVEKIEISDLDLRYENSRMRSCVQEQHLLTSICNKGIEEPLLGIVTAKNEKILLDGFKRMRCARKLNIKIVPFSSLSENESDGIIHFIKISNSKSLNMVEQAILVHDLYTKHKMTILQISERLDKSPGWTSMRLTVFREISPKALVEIISGKFPLYSYMYTMQQFMRMKLANKKEADEFIGAVSGKGFSVREIETLANCFFRGGDETKEQIKAGDITLLLQKKKVEHGDFNEKEQRFINDLEIAQKYMGRIIFRTKEIRSIKAAFFAEANLLVGGILGKLEIFRKSLKEFYDNTGETTGNMGTISGRSKAEENLQRPEC